MFRTRSGLLVSALSLPAFERQYFNRMRALNPIAYWPLWEASGSVAYDYAIVDILNGGFETAGAGGADVWATWAETAGDGALANETTIVHGGSDAAKVTAGATANTKVAQTCGVIPGHVYTLSFWTRGDGTNGGRYGVYDVSNSADIVAAVATGVTGTTYTQKTATFIAPAGCISVRIDLWCPTTDTGIAYFDDVSMREPGKHNGLYSNVTLGQAGIGDGRTSALFVPASSSNVDIYSAALAADFGTNEGTLTIWGKVADASVWLDTTTRSLFEVSTGDQVSVFIGAYKFDIDGVAKIQCSLRLNDVWVAVNISTATIDWFHVAITWSTVADEMKVYFNGSQSGSTQTGLGSHAGPIVQAKIGSDLYLQSIWSGYLAHSILLSRAATPQEIAEAARVR